MYKPYAVESGNQTIKSRNWRNRGNMSVFNILDRLINNHFNDTFYNIKLIASQIWLLTYIFSAIIEQNCLTIDHLNVFFPLNILSKIKNNIYFVNLKWEEWDPVHNFGRGRTYLFHKDERAKFMKSDLSVAGTISCWNSMISTIIQSHWNGWDFDTQTKKILK